MQVNILTHQEAEEIDASQWDSLAEKSTFTNPFFERWSLLPALKFLVNSDKVFVVTAYKDEELIVLFPILIKKHQFGLKYLGIWQHDHCFLTDPLCTSPILLAKIFNRVIRQKQVSIVQIENHSLQSYGRYIDERSEVFQSTRGAIFDPKTAKQHLVTLPRKIRMENKRVRNRLFDKTDARYLTSQNASDLNWLAEFCQLEHSGWKNIAKGSILSNPNVYRYYSAMYEGQGKKGKIQFQGLFSENEALAIAFRIVSNNQAFELKTSYNEVFRGLYPGVVLEIMNVEDLENLDFEFVDSCTNSENHLINRLWPDQRKIYTSLYFHSGFTTSLLKFVYRIKNRKKLNH